MCQVLCQGSEGTERKQTQSKATGSRGAKRRKGRSEFSETQG